MRLLLDTHVLLWTLAVPEQLAPAARSAIAQAAELRVSVVSPWELTIKIALGKLAVTRSVSEYVRAIEDQFGAVVLPATLPHVLRVADLPPHHGDPFDRLLIAQAQTENLTLVTRDAIFLRYDVPVLPA